MENENYYGEGAYLFPYFSVITVCSEMAYLSRSRCTFHASKVGMTCWSCKINLLVENSQQCYILIYIVQRDKFILKFISNLGK